MICRNHFQSIASQWSKYRELALQNFYFFFARATNRSFNWQLVNTYKFLNFLRPINGLAGSSLILLLSRYNDCNCEYCDNIVTFNSVMLLLFRTLLIIKQLVKIYYSELFNQLLPSHWESGLAQLKSHWISALTYLTKLIYDC